MLRKGNNWLFVTFEPSQLTVKSNEVFFIGFLCSFLFRLWSAHERKERAANVSPVCTLSFTLFEWLFAWSLLRGGYQMPVYFFIRQGAVNASTHNQPTILQDFLSCVFLALRNHIKHSIEDVLCPNSVNFLLHNLKIQPLIICTPLALHWIICGV